MRTMKYCFCPYIYHGNLQKLVFNEHGVLRNFKPSLTAFVYLVLHIFCTLFGLLRINFHERRAKLHMQFRSKFFTWNTSTTSRNPGLLGLEEYLQTKSASWVLPETKTEDHWLPLSNLDRVVNPTFSSLILYYQKPSFASEETSYGEVRDILKGSLAKVLVDFYPLAGRLSLRQNGLVDLHCNQSGALFLEATVDANLSVFGELKPKAALSGMDAACRAAGIGSGPLYLPNQLAPMPVLIIQLTRFKCESIAVSVNWHHMVADGVSGCHFVRSWAEVAAGKGLSLKPVHNRSLLQPRSPRDPSLVLNNKGYSKLARETKPEISQEAAIISTFGLDTGALQSLRSRLSGRASSKDSEMRRFTTVETLSAHLWQVMTRARYSKEGTKIVTGDSNVTRFFTFVDGRKRLQLPEGYFGNVVCSACAMSTEEDILNKPLAYAADLISKATRGISRDYFRSLIDWVEEEGFDASYRSEHVDAVGRDVAATFWTYFPIYDMDFGWGKPTFGARNSPPRGSVDGIAIMPSSQGSGDMFAIINLNPDRMRRLEADADFRSHYFSVI